MVNKSAVAKLVKKKPVPKSYKKTVMPQFIHARPSYMLKGGDNYRFAARGLRSLIRSRIIKNENSREFAKRQIENCYTFIHNYYIKNQEIPTFEELEKIFPYLKKAKK